MALSVEQKQKLVKSYGFELLARDHGINVGFPGSLMLKDPNSNDPDEWCIVGDSQEELLDEAIDFHDMSYYMHGDWEHIFDGKAGQRVCRIVLDTVEQSIITADVQVDWKWRKLGTDDLADLLESLNDNDIWSDRDMQEGMERSNELPDWV